MGLVPIPLACWLYFLARYHSPAYAVAGACVLAAFYIPALRPAGFPGRALDAERWGRALFVVAAAALAGLGLWQYLSAGDLGDLDHTAYTNLLWNAGHGRLGQTFQGRNMLGIHALYTAVVWIPVQWAAGGWGLKLGEAFCLIAAAVLAWRQARVAAPSWLALALILAPGVASQFFFGFHPEALGAPLLVLALAAYRDGRLGRFLILTFLLAFTKESLTLGEAGILVLAWMERRGWRWVLLPGVLCCAQMAIYWFAILPRFAPDGNPLGFMLPASAADIPGLWLRPDNLTYAWHVFLPFLPLFFGFGSRQGYPLRYLVLPLPLMAFYAAMPERMFAALWPNYAFPLAFLCAAGPVLEGRRAADPGTTPRDGGRDPRMLAACAATALLCFPLWREAVVLPGPGHARERAAVALNARIPAGASVLANSPCMERFAARREIGLWGQSSALGPRIYPPEHYDYVVLDSGFHPYWLAEEGDLRRGLAELRASPGWEAVEAGEGIQAFRRKGSAF